MLLLKGITRNPAPAGFFIARPELQRNENLVNIGD
jgi:hypothetical protein